MQQDIDQENEPLYNSRIIDTYIKLLKHRYSYVNIDEILDYAGMKAYEIADQGHWFTQKQIDRFHAIVTQKTGSDTISREAGQYAASPETVGVMRQYAMGMIGPGRVYEQIGKATAHFTKSSTYESRRLSRNTIQITVTPKEGVTEKPFQCENRMGFWEAIAKSFETNIPRIDHPQCIFNGDECCRYVITWETQGSAVWKLARNICFILLLMVCLAATFIDTRIALSVVVPISAILFFLLTMIAEYIEKMEIKTILSNLQDNSNELIEQIAANYNNSRLTNEIGEAITSLTDIEDVLNHVVQLFKKRLNYDRCLIMLANPERTRLIFRAGYGYIKDKLELLRKSAFHLDRPDAKGVFVACFKEQKPYLINNLSDIGHQLSPRSQAFARQIGARSFICCPIICDGQSIGILAVDNVKSKKPLVESDLSLLQGIAHVIGISVRNVELLDTRDRQMKSILQALAASIDARDPLTAGHSAKVTEYAMGICNELDLAKEDCEAIRVAALLHDYGKIGVPDAILKKPGRLSRDEYEIVKTHALKTRKILKQINFTNELKDVPEIAGSHHEKTDGSGYPLGLKGEAIPIGARIIAVADFFEAITAKRHYRDPLPSNVAFHLLEKERGEHFDEKIVDAFKTYYHKYHYHEDNPADEKVQKVS